MSLQNRFSRYGSPTDEWNETIHIYHTKPEKLATAKEVVSRDQNAARDIAAFEALIADLREYRQALAARYAALETMPYKRLLKLEREPDRGHGVRYYISVYRIFEDGTKGSELFERYDGKQRRDALKRFEALKKQYPGIEAVKDIERRSWER